MAETVHDIEIGEFLGRGNELDVHVLRSLDGEVPSEPTVVKVPNRAFFGWQTPRYEDMRKYLDALQEYGFHLRKGLKLIELEEGYEVKQVMEGTRVELIQNWLKHLTVGAVLKLVTKQVGGEVPNFVITEPYSSKPCMVMDDMSDPVWGPLLCEILENGERMYANNRLMVDPLGGAAISSAIRCLYNPAGSPILSNLEKGHGEIILADPGLMNGGEGERFYDIPRTRWLMALALRQIGELGFEATNMALRDHGNKINPRPLGVSNAVPKAVAFLGYNTVKLARKFWRSRVGELMCGVAEWARCLG